MTDILITIFRNHSRGRSKRHSITNISRRELHCLSCQQRLSSVRHATFQLQREGSWGASVQWSTSKRSRTAPLWPLISQTSVTSASQITPNHHIRYPDNGQIKRRVNSCPETVVQHGNIKYFTQLLNYKTTSDTTKITTKSWWWKSVTLELVIKRFSEKSKPVCARIKLIRPICNCENTKHRVNYTEYSLTNDSFEIILITAVKSSCNESRIAESKLDH